MKRLKEIIKFQLITAAVIITTMMVFAILKSCGCAWVFYAICMAGLVVTYKVFD